MRALLIDPFTKSISAIEVNSSEEVLTILGAEKLAVSAMTPQDHLIVDQDALEKPGMRFWLMGDQGMPIAGKAIIRGNSVDGLQAEPVHLDELLVQSRIQFPDIQFVGWETVPRFERLPEATPSLPNGQDHTPAALPAPPPPPAEPKRKPISIWTITEDEAGYTASLTTVDGTGKPKVTGVRLENEDLDELRSMLPSNLTKLDRTAKDDPSIVESWYSQPTN